MKLISAVSALGDRALPIIIQLYGQKKNVCLPLKQTQSSAIGAKSRMQQCAVPLQNNADVGRGLFLVEHLHVGR